MPEIGGDRKILEFPLWPGLEGGSSKGGVEEEDGVAAAAAPTAVEKAVEKDAAELHLLLVQKRLRRLSKTLFRNLSKRMLPRTNLALTRLLVLSLFGRRRSFVRMTSTRMRVDGINAEGIVATHDGRYSFSGWLLFFD